MDPDDLDLEPMNQGRFKPIAIRILVVAVAAAGAYYINGRLKRSQRTDEFERARNCVERAASVSCR